MWLVDPWKDARIGGMDDRNWTIFVAAGSLWLLVSPVIAIWWIIKPERAAHFYATHKVTSIAIFVGACTTSVCACSVGMSFVLEGVLLGGLLPGILQGSRVQAERITNITRSIAAGISLIGVPLAACWIACTRLELHTKRRYLEEVLEQNQRLLWRIHKAEKILRRKKRQLNTLHAIAEQTKTLRNLDYMGLLDKRTQVEHQVADESPTDSKNPASRSQIREGLLEEIDSRIAAICHTNQTRIRQCIQKETEVLVSLDYPSLVKKRNQIKHDLSALNTLGAPKRNEMDDEREQVLDGLLTEVKSGIMRIRIRDNPLRILRAYGVDTLLTDQDDPTLWAFVLWEYWPSKRTKRRRLRYYEHSGIEDLRFSIHNESPHVPTEEWCFDRTPSNRRRATKCIPERANTCNYDSISVDRPSAHKDQCPVSRDCRSDYLIEGGHRISWVRNDDGTWREDKIERTWRVHLHL